MALLGSQSIPKCATVGVCEFGKRPPQRSVSSPKRTPNISVSLPRAELCIVKAICYSTSPVFSRRCCMILLKTCCSHNDPLILSHILFGFQSASSIVFHCSPLYLFHCVPFTVSPGCSARYNSYLVLSNPLSFFASPRLQHRLLLIFSSPQHPLKASTSLHFPRLPPRLFGHSRMIFLVSL